MYQVELRIRAVKGHEQYEDAAHIVEVLREAATEIAAQERVDEVIVTAGAKLMHSIAPRRTALLAKKLRENYSLHHLADAVEKDETIGAEVAKLWDRVGSRADG